MNLQTSETALLTHLARAVHIWAQAGANALNEPSYMKHPEAWAALSEHLQSPDSRDAFAIAIRDLLGGIIHTTLVAFDGGSSLSDTADLTIQDQDGHEFIRYLHEFWPHFLSDAA